MDENGQHNSGCTAAEKEKTSVNTPVHEELKARNRHREPPPYRLLMHAKPVLHRFGCPLKPTRCTVIMERDKLEPQKMSNTLVDRVLGKRFDPSRRYLVDKTRLLPGYN